MRRSVWLALSVVAIGIVGANGAWAASCTHEKGAARARKLVAECREVSPATHPPCNASNSCALIESEIVRGCGMLGDDKPKFCGDFPSEGQ